MADTNEQPTKVHKLAMMFPEEGDVALTWAGPGTPDALKAAAAFAEMRANGYVAFSHNPAGSHDEVLDVTPMRDFDPAAESILMHKRNAGG